MEATSVIRVLILGPLGAGKSAFGNVLLGKEGFVSKKALSSKSVTKTFCHERVDVEGSILEVCDTPAFGEIKSLAKELGEGYDIVAIVVPIKRFTKCDNEVFYMIRKQLKDVAKTHVILVLTFADEMASSPFEFLRENEDLKYLDSLVDGRIMLIDNTCTDEVTVKRTTFITMAKELVTRNKGHRYKRESFHKEKIMKFFIGIAITFAAILSILAAVYYGIPYFRTTATDRDSMRNETTDVTCLKCTTNSAENQTGTVTHFNFTSNTENPKEVGTNFANVTDMNNATNTTDNPSQIETKFANVTDMNNVTNTTDNPSQIETKFANVTDMNNVTNTADKSEPN